MYSLVDEMRERCASLALCTVGYGHLGDGNLHLNVVASSHSPDLLSLIEPYVYERTGMDHTQSSSSKCTSGSLLAVDYVVN